MPPAFGFMQPFNVKPKGGPEGPLGSQGNPSNYNSGPNAGGFGGPGEIAGGGMVPLGGLNLPYFQQDRDRLGQLLGNRSPFASNDWDALITQLQGRANGTGPSLAGMAYNTGAQTTTNALASMSRGSASPAAAREALIQQGRVGQGQAAGYAQAQVQEQQAAQSALQGALGSRDQLNQQAYLNILAAQLGLSEGQLRALMSNQNYNLGIKGQKEQGDAAKLQALAGLAGAAAAASDERLKYDIEPITGALDVLADLASLISED